MNAPSNAYGQTSTGHNLGDKRHLDLHFEALRPEYEATLRAVQFQPGWQVLDAGSGNGVFLPLMSHLLGPSGRISAIDLAPENIEAVRVLAHSGQLACAIDARLGDITALPFEDGQFDAVWSANVSQYLTDEQLLTAVEEFRRVTRPGGIVAIKDVDVSVWQFQPQHPLVIWRLLQALQSDAQMAGAMRGTRLPHWLRRAGLVEISSTTTLAERRQPLRRVEEDYFRGNLEFLSRQAATVDLPQKDTQDWRSIAENPDALLRHADFCYRELYCLTVGRVPVR